jgi:alkanesulfonate monooxygenase SsuD/methylene tetrahydromethanopterin reductase-like flavin-dependent oxidoreductase (luciferase family)
MQLEFGIFDHMEREPGVPLDRMLEDRLVFLEEAERLGFYAYHLSEHHQVPLCLTPSQNVFLAAASQRTKTILLGGLVYLLPFYHPVRLIEEICVVDHLSGGRLQIGVGRGISPAEHEFWGLSPEESHARFEEALAILLAGLTKDELSYTGKYYSFNGLPMELTPKQLPHPPFWYAGNVEYAARHGMNFIGASGIRRLPEIAEKYRRLYAEGGAAGTLVNTHVSSPKVGTARHLYVADTDAEAEATARKAWHTYHLNYAKRGAPPPAAGPSFGGDYDIARKTEAVVVGSPDTALAFVQRYADQEASNYFVGAFQWGDLTAAQQLRSLQLFGTEVMPRLIADRRPESLQKAV